MGSLLNKNGLIKGAEYYRNWAKEMRLIADMASSENVKDILLRTAISYDNMANCAAMLEQYRRAG